MLADVFPHLVMPVGPFVAAFRTPVVEVMWNAGAGEDFGHSVGGAAVFPGAGAGREVDVAGGELLEEPGVGLVGHVIDRAVEIEVVVVHSVHGIAHVVDAGEGVAALHAIGVLGEGVGGGKGAGRGATRGDRAAGSLALGSDEGDE